MLLRRTSALALIIITLSIPSVYFANSIDAHPGNTYSDGSHHCWTRCEYWGEAYGELHYHGSESAPEDYPEPDPSDFEDTPDYDQYSGGTSDTVSPAPLTIPKGDESTVAPENQLKEDNNDTEKLIAAGVSFSVLVAMGMAKIQKP